MWTRQELHAQLRCDACGERHRLAYFRNSRRQHFEEISVDEATLYALELSAYVRARGEEVEVMKLPTRRRRGKRC